MSQTEANHYNYNLLTEAKKNNTLVGILAHGRYEVCTVQTISWDDMEDRVNFATKSGNEYWNVGIPAITKINIL